MILLDHGVGILFGWRWRVPTK